MDSLDAGLAAASPTELAKSISDLDAIVQALLKSVPQAKPWQRQLRLHLAQIERELQVLRMTISLERGESEIREAAAAVCKSLRATKAHIGASRADMGTKMAVQLAFELGHTVERRFAC